MAIELARSTSSSTMRMRGSIIQVSDLSADRLLRDTDVVDILLVRRASPLRRGVWCHSEECHNQESEAEDRHGHHRCKDLLQHGDALSHVELYVSLAGLFAT